MSRAANPRNIAIIGGGPVGLEAALYARALGHRAVVHERGEVADAVRRWGFVEMFSPWSLNVSPLGLEALRRSGRRLPPGGGFPTGRELRELYLLPIARSLGGSIEERSEVAGVARSGLLKGEEIGTPARTARPFRLLLRRDGREDEARADCVIDASGVYGQPCRLGDGGVAAPGEERAADRIDRHLPDVRGRDRRLFEGRRVLLAGGGYSAATALLDLLELARTSNAAELTWIWRRPCERPLPVFEGDPLPARDRLARAANEVAASPPRGCRALPGTVVERVEPRDDADGGPLRVAVRREDGGRETIEVDRILSLVGYRPDAEIHRELQVHLCYASEGPMKLAAALLGSSGGGDCLAPRSLGPETLASPEPGFFVIGHKSYGRRSDFLLRHGKEQVRDVFRLIEGDPRLDLYAERS